MIRYICMACVALIVVFSMASPVSADEIENGSLINVLNYSTANGSGLNSFSSGGTYVATAVYEIPFRPYVRYVDIVFTSADGVPSSVYFRNNQLNLVQLDSRLFRAYGAVTVTGSTFNLTFNSDSSGVAYNIVSFNVSSYASLAYDIEAYCDIGSIDYSTTIHYVPTDEVNYRQFLGTEDYEDNYLRLDLYSDAWKKYDFLDFQLSLTCSGINSISAMMGSNVVPVEVSLTNDSSYVTNDYFITIRMDLSGLDRTSSDYPIIIIEGVVAQGLVNNVHVVNVSGHINMDNVDPISYWLFSLNNLVDGGFGNVGLWFINLQNALVSKLDSLESAIRGDTAAGDGFQQDVEEKDQQLDDMAAVMDSVDRPELDSVNVSVDASYIDATVLASSTVALTEVMSNDIFFKVIMMSMIMATCGYVLYGKR